MKISKVNNNYITVAILSFSIVLWLVILFDPMKIMENHSHHIPEVHDMVEINRENSLFQLMISWIIMVIAMMLPKLISPIRHIHERSLKRKKLLNSILFVFGYILIWTVVGFLFYRILIFLNIPFTTSFIPGIIIGLIAIVWQFCPLKQLFLNMAHDHPSLRPYGIEANIDSLFYGLSHGVICFGSGWALMFFPMLLPIGHIIGMLIITFIMFSEHLESTRKPTWRIEFRMILIRIGVYNVKRWLKEKSF